MVRAAAVLAAAEATRDGARAALAAANAGVEQCARPGAEQRALDTRIADVEGKLGAWALLAKCLGQDGVLALLIDDAGPALASMANALLLACYGSRFTLSIKTQIETGTGLAREGFKIMVYDSQSSFPEPKLVSAMSVGQRVWINECLTRSVALYMAERNQRRHATLFSDEADGSLDPEHKRIFMAMKRKVLELGDYEREFFISHTPELTAMADAVIDLDELYPEHDGQTVSQLLDKDTPCMQSRAN